MSSGASLRGAALHAGGQVAFTGGVAGGAGLAATAAGADINTALTIANFASIPANLGAQRLIPCFPAGTPVLTPEGPRPIEELRAGDLVLSRDEHDDGTAAPTPQRIEEHFVREGELWELTLRGEVLTATPEHPFFVKPRPDAKNGGWTPAGQLEPGDLLSTDAGEWLPLEKLEYTGRRQTVYNMRVAEFATYFVAPASCSFGVWVHNTYRGIAPRSGAASIVTRDGSYARSVDFFNEAAVLDDLASSPIGRTVLEAAESNQFRLQFSRSYYSPAYGAAENRLVAGMAFTNRAKVYLPAHTSNAGVARTAVHEGVHMLGVRGSQRAEVLARAAEVLHTNGAVTRGDLLRAYRQVRSIPAYQSLPRSVGQTSELFPGIGF